VGSETGVGLICALDNASCVVLVWEEGKGFFVDWILLALYC
jgi:hypothetical protein